MSIREVLTFTKGSKKQCSWAYDILDEAFANLDNMENYIRKLDSYDAGHGEKLAGYTYAQVDEVRRFLNCCCESEQFKNAEHVINMGGQLDFDHLHDLVMSTLRANKVWDANSKQWICLLYTSDAADEL